MPYKFNNGNLAYTCAKCGTIIATAWEAVALRETAEYLGHAILCEDCLNKGEEDEVE